MREEQEVKPVCAHSAGLLLLCSSASASFSPACLTLSSLGLRAHQSCSSSEKGKKELSFFFHLLPPFSFRLTCNGWPLLLHKKKKKKERRGKQEEEMKEEAEA